MPDSDRIFELAQLQFTRSEVRERLADDLPEVLEWSDDHERRYLAGLREGEYRARKAILAAAEGGGVVAMQLYADLMARREAREDPV